MASIIKADTLQSTTANVFVLNSSGTEYARFDSSGVFQLANPTTFPAGTVALPSITATGDTNTGLYFPAADTIAFAEGGVEAMRINSSGNVGIGTTTPGTKLDVLGPAGVTSFTGTTRLGVNVQGATNTNDYSGVDFTQNGNSPRARIASYFAAGGSYLQFGTSNNYGSGITNTAMSIDPNGNVGFNSGYGSAATAYGCRAWVNFNGTGTVAIRASGNVSSITDNGTGDYTVNFTTAMVDANYSFVASAAAQYTNSLTLYAGQDANDTRSTTQLNFKTIYNNAATAATDDSPNVNIAVFR